MNKLALKSFLGACFVFLVVSLCRLVSQNIAEYLAIVLNK